MGDVAEKNPKTSMKDEGTESSSGAEDSERNHRVTFFSTVDIHVFLMTLGDNPSVSKGPPVQMEWDRLDFYQLELHPSLNEDDEANNKNRKKRDPPRISRSRRIAILQEQGISQNDIQEAEKQACLTRTERKETVWNMKRERQQERRESIRKFFSRRRTKLILPGKYQERLSSSTDIDKIPSICRNCAEKSIDDISTTRFAPLKCHGECQRRGGICPFESKIHQVEEPDEVEEQRRDDVEELDKSRN